MIILTDRDRAELESLARARKAPLRSVQRACIILAAADGQFNAQIARATRGAVPKAVHKALKDCAVDAVDQLRTLEVARLDALQAAVWEQAMTGDPKAANTVLRIIDRRIKILGLDEHVANPAPSGCSAQVDPAYWLRQGPTQPQ